MLWKWLALPRLLDNLLDDLFDQHWCAPCMPDTSAFAYEEALPWPED